MNKTQDYQQFLDQLATLRQTLTNQLSSELIQDPQVADEINDQLDAMIAAASQQSQQLPAPPDDGLAELVGIGGNAADKLGETYIPSSIDVYDEGVIAERVVAVGDLYYIYQHEKIGLFRTMLKLQEMFKAGTVRLSSGQGAFGLYQYDRRQLLRHTSRDRMQAYRRVFGYTKAKAPPGAKPNHEFHRLFILFMTQVARFYRDKRISEVIRPASDRNSFGSVSVVRRAGLDLRNNLKGSSYGHINVLRVEMLQLLNEAFRTLGTDDIRKLFGADNAWDVIEEINKRHLRLPQINISQRNRMALAGRNVLRWLAQPYVLNATRAQFEALLKDIADDAEEWLTSAEALGMTPESHSVAALPVRQSRGARELEWIG